MTPGKTGHETGKPSFRRCKSDILPESASRELTCSWPAPLALFIQDATGGFFSYNHSFLIPKRYFPSVRMPHIMYTYQRDSGNAKGNKMKTATFSNGYTDTYKGTRDVKVGWALFKLDTDEMVASGHSLSHKAAESTAKSNMKIHYDIKWCESIHGKREGVTKEDVKRMKMENSEYKASLRMEIVEL